MNQPAGLDAVAHQPWTAAGQLLRTPRYELLGASPAGVPVLLHHGFLVDGNLPWHRSGLAGELLHRGRGAVLLHEHYVREVDDARAFGHACDLLLAESLSLVVDDLGVAGVDVVADATGCAPALIAAANDSRIRKLVLRGVSTVPISTVPISTVPAAAARIAPPASDAPTFAEIDLGLACPHGRVEPLPPSPGLRLDLRAVTAATLLIRAYGDESAASDLAAALPRVTVHRGAGTWPDWDGPTIRAAADFLTS
jgi:hypothetical protein